VLPRSHSPYTAWCDWLSGFARGAEDPLEGLPAIDPEVLGGSVVARLSERCAAALQARMDLWVAALRRDLDRCRTPAEFGTALGVARRRLGPIRAFAGSELLMPGLREPLQQALEESLSKSHQGMLDQLGRDRMGGEQLLRVARENPLDRTLGLDLSDADPEPAPGGPTRRPILLG
jgi:hypothetical protein